MLGNDIRTSAGRSAAHYAAGETLEYEEEYAEVTRAVTAVNTQVDSAAMDFFTMK